MNWLDELVEGTKESESPARYFWWSGVAAIAAAVSRQVFLDRHYYTLYPNVYVLIISARSGLRKGVPIAIAKGLVEKLDIRVISGCNSIQGLTKELSMQKTFETGKVINKAQALLVSDEFETFLTEDPRALSVLTALHNTHEHGAKWEKTLKGSALEVLREPCLSLLVASNEVLFHSMVTDKDMRGGFLARSFVIHETYRRTVNALVHKPKETLDKNKLVERLKLITKINGEFKWTSDAGEFYEQWYKETADRCNEEDKTGTLERLGDQVLKLAMIVELASGAGIERPLDLTLDCLKIAIQKSEECLAGVNRLAIREVTADDAQDKAIPIIIKCLLSAEGNKLNRPKILQRTRLDAMVFDRACQTLEERQTLKPKKKEPGTGHILYELHPDVVKLYQDYRG